MFSVNGFGYRVLTLHELAKIFGLHPNHTSPPPPLLTYPLVPVQILDALLLPLLQQEPSSPTTSLVSVPAIFHDSGYTTFPLLNKNLCHSWYSHVSETNTSTKDDSAAVDVSIWNNRITLLFPHIEPELLEKFRFLLLRKLFSKLFQEFVSFMKSKYNGWLK